MIRAILIQRSQMCLLRNVGVADHRQSEFVYVLFESFMIMHGSKKHIVVGDKRVIEIDELN